MCEYPENDVDEIIPRLWLGNYKAAYNKNFLEKYQIKHILTIMDFFDLNYKYDDIDYLIIPLKDKQTCSISNMFEKTNEFIYNALKKEENILIHCKKGHHRSASIVAAFLIKYLEIDYNSAVMYINHIRPCSLRRDTCMTQHLLNYSKKLDKYNSI